ncbi:MAG: hypothetical protein ACQERB_06230 [Promethearchaeati archaeon]
MPYVFITSYIPNEKVEEAAKIHLDTIREFRKKIRGLSKEIVNAVIARKDCIEVTGIHDIKEGNLEEFLLLESKDMTNYLKVPGYRYEIEVRFKITEALEMIGMKAIEPE